MPPLKELLLFLLDPWLFMFQSLTHLPGTLLALVLAGDLPTLLSPRRLQSAWFGRFWAAAGPGVRETGEARVVPLLEGRVRHGEILASSPPPSTPPSRRRLRGVVLEVGPGTGLWASIYATVDGSNNDRDHDDASSRAARVTHVYGVEPNPAVHPELRRRVAAAGLSGDGTGKPQYEVVPCGIEDLASSGCVERGSVDCIVSILCLCSIPDPQRAARELFGYLRPGGTWFVYEHVRCESERTRECGLGMRMYQGESLAALFLLVYSSFPLVSSGWNTYFVLCISSHMTPLSSSWTPSMHS